MRPAIKQAPLNAEQQRLAAGCLTLARTIARKRFVSLHGKMPLEELEGEAFYALASAAGKFNPSRGVPFKAFAGMVIHHRLVQASKKWLFQNQLAYLEGLDIEPGEMPIDVVCIREQVDRIRASIPPRSFQAAYLVYAEECTLAEASKRLAICPERVRQLILRARRDLNANR